MVGMEDAIILLMVTMTTEWPAVTPLTVVHLAWSVEGVVLEEVTAVTGVEPLTPSTQHSQWPLPAMKQKVGSFLAHFPPFFSQLRYL